MKMLLKRKAIKSASICITLLSPFQPAIAFSSWRNNVAFALPRRCDLRHTTSSSILLRKRLTDTTELASSSADDINIDNDSTSSSDVTIQSSGAALPLRSIAVLVSAQALLLPISATLARIMHIPNYGLGSGFSWSTNTVMMGIQWTGPLFFTAGLLRLLEPYSPALQGVTRATQRSVLAVMGKERRMGFALAVSILLGGVAGWGEEWLFRGVFQTILTQKFTSNIGLAVSGLVFGLLHAVTPVYALFAALASFFFGHLYNTSGNLAVPMICHAVYDVGALMWAHWSATGLPSKVQDEILESGLLAPIID
jgi:membrane protease YdiL (CAAX protease family)